MWINYNYNYSCCEWDGFEYKTKKQNIVCCIEKDKCKIYTYHDASNSGVTSMYGTTHNATFDNWSFICVVTASNVSYIQIII